MRLKDLGERRIITEIRRRLGGGRRREDVRLGMGDDAAVVRGLKNLVITSDLLVEGYDFRKRLHPPRLLGRKSLNVNLSDIAAMGGRPRHSVLGLALPGQTDWKWLSEFFRGFGEAAHEARVVLVGGDFSEGREIMISVTVTGSVKTFVPRSGAKPGDFVYVSGCLGDAAAGLRLLERGCRPGGTDRATASLLKAFLDPTPRLALGATLARRKLASAMIDVSDGLTVDLAHVCEESRVGAEVELSRIPLSNALRRFSRNPLPLALDGGEDFELLFTVRPGDVLRLGRLPRRFKITPIGRITAGERIVAIDAAGRKKPLEIRGYEHFKS